MPRDAVLHPDARGLYGDMLRPPPGYEFDAGVATTFSLDFDTALAVPVALSLQAASSREAAEASPLALLEGVERCLDRLAVFVEGGRIQAKALRRSRLCALLDDMIVEVAAPGGGAFHPKIWALRYTCDAAPPRLRLLVLSRNLTRDLSWDLSLSLDGEIGAEDDPANAPVAGLIEALPGLSTARASKRVQDLTRSLAADVARARWETPAPFETLSFAVNGLGAPSFTPKPAARMAVISPFCDPHALQTLTLRRDAPDARLIGRNEELAKLPPETLARFARIEVLDEAAETEDGEDAIETDGEAPGLRGLHAKVFAMERGWDLELTVGSGNATSPALISGRNVEAFATLTGKRSKTGSVDEILAATGFGRLLREFRPGEAPAPDPEAEAAEARLEEARALLAAGKLTLACGAPEDGPDRATPLTLRFRGRKIPQGVGAEVWPLILGDGHKHDAAPLLAGENLPLGAPALRDICRFIVVRLTDAATGATLIFALGARIEGLPEDRDAAILRSLIDGADAFLRYLRLLMGEVDDPFGAAFAAGAAEGTGAFARATEPPLLENMVRALIDGPHRLRDVERLLSRLSAGARPGDPPAAPAEFLELWEAFRAVIPKQARR